MLSWFSSLTKEEWRTIVSCFGGWALNAFDLQIYTFVVPTLLTAWGISRGEAGVLGTIALLFSAFGGWFAGRLSDRFGRVRVFQITVLWYAAFTFLSGFTQNVEQLFVCRALQGLGFGGEWSAGAVLVGEVVQSRYRGRAVGIVQSGWSIGWGAAAVAYTLLFSLMPDHLAWRVLFWASLAPVLPFLWVCRHLKDPSIYREQRHRPHDTGSTHLLSIFGRQYLATTLKASLLTTGAQGAAYAFLVWLPTYFKTVRGLSVVNTGGFLLVFIVGGFCGLVAGAYLSDAIGRKATFMSSTIGAAIIIVLYVLLPIGDAAMLVLGFPLGFFGHTMFSPMGSYLTELYPTHIRCAGQGFCYNVGRGMGAVFPTLVGFLSGVVPLGQAIGIFSIGAYGLVITALLMLPETAGRSLESAPLGPERSQGI
jgi:MFS family permease